MIFLFKKNYQGLCVNKELPEQQLQRGWQMLVVQMRPPGTPGEGEPEQMWDNSSSHKGQG